MSRSVEIREVFSPANRFLGTLSKEDARELISEGLADGINRGTGIRLRSLAVELSDISARVTAAQMFRYAAGVQRVRLAVDEAWRPARPR